MTFDLLYESNINQWVSALGYAGVAAIIFSETAFFFCFFLPGDSLLISAGILAKSHIFNLYVLLPIIVLSAFLGYLVGYWIGFYFENWVSRREDSWYYKKSYEEKARVFMEKYESVALLYGRFIPFVRTFIPMIAGMLRMPFGMYTLLNFFGAVLWGMGVTLLGYYLGAIIPELSDYVWIAVIAVILISFISVRIIPRK